MILTTEQQAHNFALYALDSNDPLLNGLNHECLVGALMANITQVFGSYTFSEAQLETIAQTAIRTFEDRY